MEKLTNNTLMKRKLVNWKIDEKFLYRENFRKFPQCKEVIEKLINQQKP